jgi:hypothetical protein
MNIFSICELKDIYDEKQYNVFDRQLIDRLINTCVVCPNTTNEYYFGIHLLYGYVKWRQHLDKDNQLGIEIQTSYINEELEQIYTFVRDTPYKLDSPLINHLQNFNNTLKMFKKKYRHLLFEFVL